MLSWTVDWPDRLAVNGNEKWRFLLNRFNGLVDNDHHISGTGCISAGQAQDTAGTIKHVVKFIASECKPEPDTRC